jgi:hypothetical protein
MFCESSVSGKGKPETLLPVILPLKPDIIVHSSSGKITNKERVLL